MGGDSVTVTIGILLFDGADELDFVGPLDVFSYASGWGSNGRVVTIGREIGVLRGGNGLSFLPAATLADYPALDVLVIPGGMGVDAVIADPQMLDWIRSISANARWVCSVCTGAFVLQAAGLTDGKRVTTHSGMTAKLRATGTGTVVDGERFVVDGNLVTAAGVSAGIDMALWVVAQLYGTDHARTVRAQLDYDPAPPV